jgi:ribonuclease HII
MHRTEVTASEPDLFYELELLRSGCKLIAGVDEAGRGAWAGPVVAAAVVLPIQRFDLAYRLNGVQDSKQMTPAQRAIWFSSIQELAQATAIGFATAQEIDRLGLSAATRKAMQHAIAQLGIEPQHLLIDHIRLPEVDLPQTAITHGDARIFSIAAASVIAKVARDRAMVAFGRRYPGYGFEAHKGYGTRTHREALHRLGPCEIHRRSYTPVEECSAKIRET